MTSSHEISQAAGARGYSWPPFQPGNDAAVRHGARSPALVEPAAAALLNEVLADAALAYLDVPAYAPVLRNWAVAQAQSEIFGAWLFAQDVDAQLLPPRGGAKSPLDTWLGLVKTATSLADRLGLTPLSRARLGRDVSTAGAMQAAALERLRAQGRTELQARDAGPAVLDSGAQP